MTETTTDPRPEVSVLLAVHNGEDHLEAALRSVMTQSLRDIEIVVVDDGSTDSSPEIARRLAEDDPRIRVFRTPENLRLPGALNFGLERVRGRYVARMDDDDISLPHRLETQRDYLDANPDVSLLGGSIEWIDGDDNVSHLSVRARDPYSVNWTSRFFLVVSHPTFMFRPVMPDGTPLRYRPDYPLCEDHDLICRLLRQDVKICTLPNVMLRYRRHEGSISVQRFNEQLQQARAITTAYTRDTLPPEVHEAIEPLRELFFDLAPATPERTRAAFAGAKAMLRHDVAQHPDRSRWIHRQTAHLLVWALQRGKISWRDLGIAFVRYWPGLMPAAAMRRMETLEWVPGIFHSDPLPHGTWKRGA